MAIRLRPERRISEAKDDRTEKEIALNTESDRRGELTVRDARDADLAFIGSLLRAVGLPKEGVLEFLNGFVVLEREGEPIGCVGLECYGDKALLRSLAVRKDRQGMGYGQLLYEAILEKAKREGVSEIYLLTETAERFFSERGFESVSRELVDERVRASIEFTSACPETAACLRMRLK